jgi:hypothetical protein
MKAYVSTRFMISVEGSVSSPVSGLPSPGCTKLVAYLVSRMLGM